MFLPEYFGWMAWNEYLEPSTAQILEAVFQYLVEMSFRRPLLLVIEDIHQVDEPSLNLLAYVIRQLRYEHILVLLTSRDITSENPLWVLQRQLLMERTLTRMSISPLTKEQIGRLVPSTVEDKQQNWTQFLQTWAGGNPRFALDLLFMLQSGLLTGESTNRDALWLSGEITDTLEAHLEKVSPQARKMLSKVAALGTPCPFPLLLSSMDDGRSSIRDEDRFFELLDEVHGKGLLLEEMTKEKSIIYHFRHPLMAVYLLQ
jgi:predicted ATPase